MATSPVAVAHAACALGVALLVGVMTWKLTLSTYRRDLVAICQGEAASGLSMRSDMARVTERIRGYLRTSEGNLFFSSLRDLPVDRRAERLGAQAEALAIRPCPLAASYAELAVEAEYRSDIQRVCSYVTFPGLAELDGPRRLATLEAWIDEVPANPRTREMGAWLRRTRTLSESGSVLRDAAIEAGVWTCDVAKVLASPRVVACTMPVP
jgi:hypothetical protein